MKFAALRVYVGLFWLSHGVPKFLHASAFMPPTGFMPQLVQHAAATQSGFYHDFLVHVVLPNIGLFAELTRLGEVLAGCSLVLGCLTRFGGVVGAFLALNYMAAQGEFGTWTTIGSLDALAFVLSAAMVFLPAGRFAGVDALFVRRRPVQRTVVPEFVDEPPPQAPAV